MRVRLQRGGKLSFVDGPFTETKEVIGGYAILEAPSKAEAVELTRRYADRPVDGGPKLSTPSPTAGASC